MSMIASLLTVIALFVSLLQHVAAALHIASGSSMYPRMMQQLGNHEHCSSAFSI